MKKSAFVSLILLLSAPSFAGVACPMGLIGKSVEVCEDNGNWLGGLFCSQGGDLMFTYAGGGIITSGACDADQCAFEEKVPGKVFVATEQKGIWDYTTMHQKNVYTLTIGFDPSDTGRLFPRLSIQNSYYSDMDGNGWVGGDRGTISAKASATCRGRVGQ